MPLVQQFIHTWPDGSTPISIEDWLLTLPQSEQDEYQESRRNQDRLRQVAIDEGRMIMTDFNNATGWGTYVWKDAEAFDVGKQHDPIWLRYWQRWEKETGVIFTMETIEE